MSDNQNYYEPDQPQVPAPAASQPQFAYDPNQPQYGNPTTLAPMSGLAIGSFVTSLVGFFLFGVVLGPIGVILGLVSLSKDIKRGKRGRGFAIAGIILGVLALIGGILAIVLLVMAARPGGIHYGTTSGY